VKPKINIRDQFRTFKTQEINLKPTIKPNIQLSLKYNITLSDWLIVIMTQNRSCLAYT
jgi:hypothetical protein